jgi:hypothetical protein
MWYRIRQGIQLESCKLRLSQKNYRHFSRQIRIRDEFELRKNSRFEEGLGRKPLSLFCGKNLQTTQNCVFNQNPPPDLSAFSQHLLLEGLKVPTHITCGLFLLSWASEARGTPVGGLVLNDAAAPSDSNNLQHPLLILASHFISSLGWCPGSGARRLLPLLSFKVYKTMNTWKYKYLKFSVH